MKGSQSLSPSKHKPPGETGRGQLLWVEGAEGAPRRPCGPAGPPGRASHAARVAAGAPVLRSRDLGLGVWAAVPELVGVTWDGCSGGPRPPYCPGLTVQSHGAAARPRGPTAHWTMPPLNPWAALGRWLNSPLRAVCLSGPPLGGNHAVCSAAVSLRPFNTEQLPGLPGLSRPGHLLSTGWMLGEQPSIGGAFQVGCRALCAHSRICHTSPVNITPWGPWDSSKFSHKCRIRERNGRHERDGWGVGGPGGGGTGRSHPGKGQRPVFFRFVETGLSCLRLRGIPSDLDGLGAQDAARGPRTHGPELLLRGPHPF